MVLLWNGCLLVFGLDLIWCFVDWWHLVFGCGLFCLGCLGLLFVFDGDLLFVGFWVVAWLLCLILRAW